MGILDTSSAAQVILERAGLRHDGVIKVLAELRGLN